MNCLFQRANSGFDLHKIVISVCVGAVIPQLFSVRQGRFEATLCLFNLRINNAEFKFSIDPISKFTLSTLFYIAIISHCGSQAHLFSTSSFILQVSSRLVLCRLLVNLPLQHCGLLLCSHLNLAHLNLQLLSILHHFESFLVSCLFLRPHLNRRFLEFLLQRCTTLLIFGYFCHQLLTPSLRLLSHSDTPLVLVCFLIQFFDTIAQTSKFITQLFRGGIVGLPLTAMLGGA
mmetsp:Transcript_34153/g.69770  ORF Transcript_34153/g.69770 Transcript_34153/m.69770 type:complete len:231 (-) Transcript_34153:2453-3145(-)